MNKIIIELTEDQIVEVMRGLDDRLDNLHNMESPNKTKIGYAERLLAKFEKLVPTEKH